MIDDAIDTHVRALLAEAYPAVTEDQILVLFPSASLDFSQGHRRAPGGGHIIGAETITVHAVVATEDKVDRVALIRLLKRQNVSLSHDGETWTALQEFQRTEQRDYVEAAQMKGTMFVINYTHGIS